MQILDLYEGFPLLAKELAIQYRIDRPTAQDILQDVFLHLYSIHGENDLETPEYIVRAAFKNKLKDYYKIRKRAVKRAYSFYKTIVGQVLEECEDRALFKALVSLTPSYKNVLTMFYKYKYSHAQMAKRLKLSENTVKAYLRCGRNQIKQNLMKLYELFNRLGDTING